MGSFYRLFLWRLLLIDRLGKYDINRSKDFWTSKINYNGLLVILCRERERESQKKEEEKVYIEEFKKSRDDWKVKEKHRLEEENRKIAQFAHLQEQREGARQEAKKEQEETRAHVQKEVRNS